MWVSRKRIEQTEGIGNGRYIGPMVVVGWGGVGWGGLPGQSRRAEGIRQKTKRDGSCQTMRVPSKLSLESSGRECYIAHFVGVWQRDCNHVLQGCGQGALRVTAFLRNPWKAWE